MICYKADGISREEIRYCVRKLKRLVGLEYKKYFPILVFAENILPLMIQGYQFEVVPVEEMGNKHGETYPSKNLIRIREDVYIGAADGKPRDRMTVAHEIGHLFLHENDSVALCRLAPTCYLIIGMNELEVRIICGVSSAAALINLRSVRYKIAGGG